MTASDRDTPSAASAPSLVIQRAASGLQLSEAAQRVHDVLPQTQCQRCGEADCAHYAQAVVDGSRAINRCQPGGQAGIERIAQALGNMPIKPSHRTLDAECGVESPMHVAVIDEAWCIGCTLCINVCPTDAIVGSNKFMHTVIEPYCTGCDLCALACPVDCIAMESTSGDKTGWDAWSYTQAQQALQRYEAHQVRQQQHDAKNQPLRRAQTRPAAEDTPQTAQVKAVSRPKKNAQNDKQSAIQAALQRARAKRTGDVQPEK